MEMFHAEVITGDAFAVRHPSVVPDMIIIDVEGFEIEVLSGMEKLIHESYPVVIVEHIFAHPATFDHCFPEGYRRFTIDDDTGALIDGYDINAGHNSVYLPKWFFNDTTL